MRIIRPAHTSFLGFLFLGGVAVQVAILVGRSGAAANPVAPESIVVGDTLVALTGGSGEGSRDYVEIRTPSGAATVVYVFSSTCAFCDDVAPDWAEHFRRPGTEHVRRVAITRDGPQDAVEYAKRFGWDVRILSMPDLAATDRASSLLSRTPWLYVFDPEGVLRFEGHGSALKRADEVAVDVAIPSSRRGRN
ncbi:MAG: hypothetical protein OXG18_00490 [Gemmatimonadetes bacterium]|nr:hypothetical protein [Gemmatimonadota bacterium]